MTQKFNSEFLNGNNNGYISIEQAKNLLIKENEERIEKCKDEMEKLLIKYNCTFDISVTLTSRQIIPQILIISK